MVRAVLYARYSSDNQRAESAHAQIRAARAYCDRYGYTVIREFVDEEISGKTDKRPDFQRMIAFVRAGEADVVVVHKVDRWARNRYDAAHYRHLVKKAGARVEYVEQRIDGSPESVILESVLDGMAEYYSLNLAAEVMKGKRETALAGKWNGGTPPLGYRVVDGFLVVDETEAAAVRKIFEMKASGEGYGPIIDELNRAGFRTKRGGPFGKNSLHDILVNRKYVGVFSFGRVRTDRDGKRNTHQDSENFIELPGGVPAIITPELWAKVQERIQADKVQAGRYSARETYLLSGKVRCECGSAMNGSRGTNQKGIVFPYYRCSNAHGKRACSAGKVGRDWLEKLVSDALDVEVCSPGAADRLVTAVTVWQSVVAREHLEEIKALEARKADADRRVQRLLEAIEEGTLPASTVRSRFDEMRERIATADDRLAEIKAASNRIYLTEEQIRAIFDRWSSNENSPPDRRALIDTFIDHVLVTKDQVLIKFRLAEQPVCSQMVETRGIEPLTSKMRI